MRVKSVVSTVLSVFGAVLFMITVVYGLATRDVQTPVFYVIGVIVLALIVLGLWAIDLRTE